MGTRIKRTVRKVRVKQTVAAQRKREAVFFSLEKGIEQRQTVGQLPTP